jgi:hypothetical protein
MLGYVAAGLAGALVMFFLDPDRGRSRRAVTRDRFAGSARRGGLKVGRISRRISAEAYGAKQEIVHLDSEARSENDPVIARTVSLPGTPAP